MLNIRLSHNETLPGGKAVPLAVILTLGNGDYAKCRLSAGKAPEIVLEAQEARELADQIKYLLPTQNHPPTEADL